MDHLSPEEQRMAEQGRAAIAAAVARTRAPLALRERLEADRARHWRGRRRRALLGPVAATATLAAVVVLGLSLGNRDGVTGGGRAGGPTVLALASLAARPIAEPAPRADPAHPGSLTAAVDDVAFPTYGGTRWRASGARSDRVSGAPVRTVHYRGPGRAMVAYSIVAGTRLPAPAGGRTVRFRGTDYRLSREGGRIVVAWEREGHTCVLSAPAQVGGDALLRLAWWEA